MHDFTELDRKLDLNNPEKYHLSIQLMPDGFSFCILETYIRRYVGAKHYQFKENLYFDDLLDKIDKILISDILLHPGYKTVSIMHISKNALLIPEDVFKKEEVRVYFDINEYRDDLEEIHYNYIPLFKAYNVFSVHHELLNLFRNKYDHIGIYHQWSSLLNLRDLEDTVTGIKVYVNFNWKFFDLVIVKEKKLILCNSFNIDNENDFVFYLLNSLKQLKIDSSKSEIIIIGDILHKTRYFELLGKFVKSFELGDAGDEFSFSPTLKNTYKPVFNNLYNLYRCVLLEENTEV